MAVLVVAAELHSCGEAEWHPAIGFWSLHHNLSQSHFQCWEPQVKASCKGFPFNKVPVIRLPNKFIVDDMKLEQNPHYLGKKLKSTNFII